MPQYRAIASVLAAQSCILTSLRRPFLSFLMNSSKKCSVRSMPPTEVDDTSPMRFVLSIAVHDIASLTAMMPSSAVRDRCLCCGMPRMSCSSSFVTRSSPTGNLCLVFKIVGVGDMPLMPERICSRFFSTPIPSADTIPTPVTTIFMVYLRFCMMYSASVFTE